MEEIFYVLVAIMATVGCYSIVKIAYYRVETWRRHREDREMRIANIDTLNNKVRINFNSIGNIHKKLNKLESRVGIIEVLADNFERDMDRYHANTTKYINERINAITDRFKKVMNLKNIKVK